MADDFKKRGGKPGGRPGGRSDRNPGGPSGGRPRGGRSRGRDAGKGKKYDKTPEIVLTPSRWVGRGEALVETEFRPLLVWGGIPGEPGRVHVYHRGQNLDRGRWVGSDEPSDTRRAPPCDKYDRCGGCPLMHLEPAAQQDARLNMVARLFAEHKVNVALPLEVVASPDGDENYRYVVKMAAGWSDWQRTRLGAYERDSHKVLPIPNCRVATSSLRRAMGTITHHVVENNIEPWDEETERGVLRHVVIRQSRLTRELMVTLVVGRRPKVLHDLATDIAHSIAEVAGVHIHVNGEPGNAIYHVSDGVIRTRPLEGKRTIEDEIAGVKMRIGPGDFFQANPATADLIVRDVISLTEDLRDRPVVDLYCGVGAIALPMAKHHPWVGGIEVSGGAVDRARESASIAKLSAEFLAGTVEERLPEMIARVKDAAPVVILDPARRGLEPEVFDPIESMNPSRMIYVSCNPASLARDLAEWIKRGWTVGDLRAYDMFPQTGHVEMLAVLNPPSVPVPKKGGPRRRFVR
jgi:23S rRNA (uracil1939-C5)-methyltransferase